MASMKKRLAAAVAAAGLSLGLGGCMGDYGYGGVGYASDYYGGYGDGYGYGYGPSLAYGGYGGYGGWYNDFYYPGTGIYVFDRSGHRSRWNDGQRRYWEGRRGQGQGRGAQWQGRGAQWQGQRADWQGQRGPGRPGGERPGRDQSYGRGDNGQRGGWQGNRQGRPVTNAQANAILGRPSDYRPSSQGVSNGWRGQGGASMSRGSGSQGRMGGGFSRGGGGGGHRPH